MYVEVMPQEGKQEQKRSRWPEPTTERPDIETLEEWEFDAGVVKPLTVVGFNLMGCANTDIHPGCCGWDISSWNLLFHPGQPLLPQTT